MIPEKNFLNHRLNKKQKILIIEFYIIYRSARNTTRFQNLDFREQTKGILLRLQNH